MLPAVSESVAVKVAETVLRALSARKIAERADLETFNSDRALHALARDFTVALGGREGVQRARALTVVVWGPVRPETLSRAATA